MNKTESLTPADVKTHYVTTAGGLTEVQIRAQEQEQIHGAISHTTVPCRQSRKEGFRDPKRKMQNEPSPSQYFL